MFYLNRINHLIGSVHLNVFNSLLLKSTINSATSLHVLVCISFFLMESNNQNSVLPFMYCIVLSMMPFSYEECRWCFNFRNLHACGFHVSPSVEIGCLPWCLIINVTTWRIIICLLFSYYIVYQILLIEYFDQKDPYYGIFE